MLKNRPFRYSILHIFVAVGSLYVIITYVKLHIILHAMLDIRFVFTNEEPFLIENLTPAIYLRIRKFVLKNNLNLKKSPSLGLKVSDGINVLDTRKFESLLKTNQKNPNVMEANLDYYLEKAGALKIEIENQNPERPFQIAMYYTLERRTK